MVNITFVWEDLLDEGSTRTSSGVKVNMRDTFPTCHAVLACTCMSDGTRSDNFKQQAFACYRE
jgi:hypothetical protein